MNQSAVIAVLAWPVVSLALCAALGAWRGVIATYLGSYLLLSGGVLIPMAGLPDYTKYTAATIGALIGTLAFAPGRLAAFRPRWYDLPALAICLTPVASFFANDLPSWQGVTAVSDSVLRWGMPYFIGRIYAERPGADRDLAVGLTLAGALLMPAIAFEVFGERSVSGILYGLPVSNGYKYGFYRPVLMAVNSLELALWSALTAVSGFALWCTRAVPRVAGVGVGWWAAAAAVGAVLCLQTAAVGLMLLGLFLLSLIAGRRRFGALPEAAAVVVVLLLLPKLGGRITLTSLATIAVIRHSRDRHPGRLVAAAALAAPAYLVLRLTDAMTLETVTYIASTLLGPARAISLNFRIVTEELMVAYLMGHDPLLGWGTFAGGRGWPPGVNIVDSYWVIQVALYGIAGLAALYGMLALPPLLAAHRRPASRWDEPRNGAAAGLSIALIIYAMDSVLNAYIILAVPLMAGVVAALPAARAGASRAGAPRSADRALERVDRLAGLGRPAEAEAACRRLIAARAAEPAGHAALADACDRLADLQEALGRPVEAASPRRHALDLRAALAAADPGAPEARDALAGCAERLARNLAARGRPFEAAEARGLALGQRAALAAADPDDPAALLRYADGLNDLAWLLAEADDPSARDPARAVALAERAARLGPGRKAYWNTLGAAYRRAGDPGLAVAALRRSAQLGPDALGFDDALLAPALAALGDLDGARAALARLDARLSTLGPDAPASLRRLRNEAASALPRAPAGSP